MKIISVNGNNKWYRNGTFVVDMGWGGNRSFCVKLNKCTEVVFHNQNCLTSYSNSDILILSKA